MESEFTDTDRAEEPPSSVLATSTIGVRLSVTPVAGDLGSSVSDEMLIVSDTDRFGK